MPLLAGLSIFRTTRYSGCLYTDRDYARFSIYCIPFIVRTVQPVLSDIETELEEAASALGANRWQTITKIILPILLPALFTGFALAFARGVGEYGSVIFIAGNQPFKTEIAPLMIISRLEEYDYAGATTIAAVMLVLSFIILFAINLLQAWANRRTGRNIT